MQKLNLKLIGPIGPIGPIGLIGPIGRIIFILRFEI